MTVEEENKPKVVRVFNELDLIAPEVRINLGKEDSGEGEYYYVVDPDPNVTETITCTEMVCSSSQIKFVDKINSIETKMVLPSTIRFGNEVKVNLRRINK